MNLNKETYKEYKQYPERVLQFGEGNFLRAFVDWQIDKMNKEAGFNGSVVVVQPIENGLVDKLNDQDGLYTLYLQGMNDGKAIAEHSVINSISRGINPYTQHDEYMKIAENKDLRFVFSNTTEAGIAYDEKDKLEDIPQKSFPGKLTALLYNRFKFFNGQKDKGLIMIPCELIDRNGDKLKEIILKYAKLWNLEGEFALWINEANTFCSTLVDRIVPGYPRDTIKEITEELGYVDNLVVVGEHFHLFIIEGPKWIENEFPASKAGLNVMFVKAMAPYRTRKVRILNGSHTSLVPVSYLYGLNTVAESVDHEVIGKFIRDTIYEEIISTLDLPKEELSYYAKVVLERFMNPFVKHYLMSISLNSMSKYETRDLPSLLQFVKVKNELPKRLVFSLAALMEFYKGKRGEEIIKLSDDVDVLELYKTQWDKCDGSEVALRKLVTTILAYKKVWKMDLNEVKGLTEAVTHNLLNIEKIGIKEAIKEVL
ncbi:tagaturonate reductase [Clostridium estertheticum]|uniref:Altronate oxidoreductase n=1 Tax=Clostridium estertheticum subsp. estertheticum TaxID=1552 RepID=A0A1J0GFM3_9CLOT|nr:tagaturonate reductase [Clostridium estertheticum]APC39776.1 altronate oxidoreductase [Clostridium estertheticum subsp. estertheticum]MBZ9614176.1 tagaturonate reductase [Clostridium estertheticum subsp. laramiense]WAG74121.1 tagaturonate reductase [Clostridium estertheticum]